MEVSDTERLNQARAAGWRVMRRRVVANAAGSEGRRELQARAENNGKPWAPMQRGNKSGFVLTADAPGGDAVSASRQIRDAWVGLSSLLEERGNGEEEQ